MAAVIERYGHAVQYVLDDTGTGKSSLAYTVGFHAHPGRGYELAVSGLPPEVAVELLNNLAAVLGTSHDTPADGLDFRRLLQDGLTLRLRKVSRPQDLTIIHAFSATTPPVWQALWPDTNGNYPGDPGYALSDSAQRLLCDVLHRHDHPSPAANAPGSSRSTKGLTAMNDLTPPAICGLTGDAFDDGADRAVSLIEQLVHVLGPGRHTLTCVASHPGGTLLAALEVEIAEDDVCFTGRRPSEMVIALAHAIASDVAAGLVARSHHHDGDRDVVRGWLISDGGPEPLTEEQVKTAYGTDGLTGKPLRPEPDTVYQPGL